MAGENRSLVAKWAQVMKEIGYVQKRGTNTFHNYKYVMEADLCDAVREKLAARSVIMIPSVVSLAREKVTLTNKRGETADSLLTDVMVEYTVMDGDSGESFKFQMPGCGADTGDKGVYKAITGSDKYALMKAFLIPTGDDPEADAETDARAEGFKQATQQERKELVDKKIDDLKQRVQKQSDNQTVDSGSEALLQGRLDSVSQVKYTKDKNTPYIIIRVVNESGEKEVSVWDKKLFDGKSVDDWPISGYVGKDVRCIVKLKGKYANLVAIESVTQIKYPEPEVEITNEDIPF